MVDDDDGKPERGYVWAVQVATEMIVATMIGLAMGYWVDRWLDTKPWGMLIFFLFGTAAGFLNLYRAVSNMAEENLDDKDASS